MEAPKEEEWEVRPCGMLVQRRLTTGGTSHAPPPPPPIRLRIAHGSAAHEVYLSPHSTFGDLKKLLSDRTGLHPLDQKLLFKGKERDSAAFLDLAGVKDRSKILLSEDSAARARRLMDLRKAAASDKAAAAVAHVTRSVDKLSSKVSQLTAIVAKGKKAADADVTGLIEQLMDQLLKLDAVVADGDVRRRRREQVTRVQKLVESLDELKIKNAAPKAALPPPRPEVNGPAFDLLSDPPPPAAAAVKLKWELF
ncbi:BAG family molecular chaperone regulator 3-like [Wolffia australiana]